MFLLDKIQKTINGKLCHLFMNEKLTKLFTTHAQTKTVIIILEKSNADVSDTIWKYVAFTLIGSITTVVVVGLLMLIKSL